MSPSRFVFAALVALSAVSSTGCQISTRMVPPPPLLTPAAPSSEPLAPGPTTGTTVTTPIAGALPGAFPEAQPGLSVGFPLVELTLDHTAVTSPGFEESTGDASPPTASLEFRSSAPMQEFHVDVLYDSKRCTVVDVEGNETGQVSTESGWALLGGRMDVVWRTEPTTGTEGDTRLMIDLKVSPGSVRFTAGTLCMLRLKVHGGLDRITFTPVAPREANRAMNFVELAPGGLQPVNRRGRGNRLGGSISGSVGPVIR